MQSWDGRVRKYSNAGGRSFIHALTGRGHNVLRERPREFFFIFIFLIFFGVRKYYIYIDSIQMIKGSDKEKMLQ